MKKIDLSGQVWSQFEQAKLRAQRLVEEGKLGEAATDYRRCADLLRQYSQYAITEGIRNQWLDRARKFEELAARAAAGQIGQVATESMPDDGDIREAVRALVTKSIVSWDDVGGLDETKKQIQTLYGLAMARKPKGVTVGAARRVLLYGPPGTGKTLLAAATSHELEATFFNVRIGDVLSKYFGESSKLVSALYREALAQAPSVIFMDEFEALTASRDNSDSGAERRVLSTLLTEIDGLEDKRLSDGPYVLTMAATNLPWMIDKAILSRFGARLIYVPLPDESARRAILEIEIARRGYNSELTVTQLTKLLDGYSGREIQAVIEYAATRMLERANPELIGTVRLGREALHHYTLAVETISTVDFDQARAAIGPTTSTADVIRYETWRNHVES